MPAIRRMRAGYSSYALHFLACNGSWLDKNISAPNSLRFYQIGLVRICPLSIPLQILFLSRFSVTSDSQVIGCFRIRNEEFGVAFVLCGIMYADHVASSFR